MFEPLFVAATGLNASEQALLGITNNLSNSQTTGFKRGTTQMESLNYVPTTFQDALSAAMDSQDQTTNIIPEFGTGVKVSATPSDFTQGTITTTSNALDIAVQGEGFFQVKMPDGTPAYTRAGNLHADNDGNLVDSNGHFVEPAIVIPQGTTSVVIKTDGTVLVSVNNSTSQEEIGQISLVRFQNPAGLKSLGQNLYSATDASGEGVVGSPTVDGFGSVTQYALESSNVDVISEMMRMVMVQRVFDTITKAVSSYEAMLTSLERMKA